MSEKIPMRIQKGALVPADRHAVEALRSRKFSTGGVVFAKLSKPRNPRYHRLAHAFGQLLTENLEAFEGLDGHTALKRIQLEANIGCDEIALNFPGIGPCSYRIPKSLSFESMDQSAFEDVYSAMCAYVARTYWPGLSAEQVAEMVDLMPEVAV